MATVLVEAAGGASSFSGRFWVGSSQLKTMFMRLLLESIICSLCIEDGHVVTCYFSKQQDGDAGNSTTAIQSREAHGNLSPARGIINLLHCSSMGTASC